MEEDKDGGITTTEEFRTADGQSVSYRVLQVSEAEEQGLIAAALPPGTQVVQAVQLPIFVTLERHGELCGLLYCLRVQISSLASRVCLQMKICVTNWWTHQNIYSICGLAQSKPGHWPHAKSVTHRSMS